MDGGVGSQSRAVVEVACWLAEQVPGPPGGCVVDLVCGPGTMTEVLLRRWGRMRPGGAVYAVDPSAAELARARRPIRSRYVRFVRGRPEDLSRLVPVADLIVCHGLHGVSDTRRVFREVRRVLRPGGIFSFATPALAGCEVRGTERFYQVWRALAVRELRAHGVRVVRGQGEAWPSPEDYEALLALSGFGRASWCLHSVALTPGSLDDPFEASPIVGCVLPGVPVVAGAQALRGATMAEALREAGLPASVPRFWLQCVGYRQWTR